MKKTKWFLKVGRPSVVRMRMFCFPYAGASGSLEVFRDWARDVPEGVEVATLELPGRGTRYGEPLQGSLSRLTVDLMAAIRPMLDLPYIIFGHSIGALISFELVRAIVRSGLRLPEVLIASGKRAPQLANELFLHELPDPELLEALKDYNGTPAEVLRNPELMELFLPILRADFSLSETYVCQPLPPLPVPLYAFGGVGDTGVKERCLRAWGDQTSAAFSCEMFPGDHFFLQGEGRAAVKARVLELLTAARAASRSYSPARCYSAH